MGKKHKHPEHENLERWLVSYADFITLLFATFTALFAMASSDLAKMKDVGQAIQEGFQQQSLFNGIKSVMQGKSPPQDNPNILSKRKGMGAGVVGKYESLSYTPGEVKKFDQAVHDLKSDIDAINKKIRKVPMGQGTLNTSEKKPGGVELSVQERGIRVSFDSSLLFDPGSAVLKDEALQALDAVAGRLKKLAEDHLVQVEGHTDNMPIFTAIYPSNWELSAARSGSVVRYLIQKHQYSSEHMSVVGFADSRPAESNETPEGRRKNRRIDIILYNRIDGNRTDPNYQRRNETTVTQSQQDAPPDASQGVSGNPASVSPATPGPQKSDGGPGESHPAASDGPVRVVLKTHSGTKVIDPVANPAGKTAKLSGLEINKEIETKRIDSP